MLKTLLLNRLLVLLSVLTGSARTKTAQSKGKLVAFAMLMVLSAVSLGSYFWMIFHTIATPFAMAGLGWLYIAMAALLALALMLIGGSLMAKSQLYEAKDNELLLSMPIPPRAILLSRMFLLWAVAMICDLVVFVPALMNWPGLSGGGIALVLFLFIVPLPLLALAISALVGWLLHRVSAAFGHRSIVTVISALILVVLYMILNFRTNAMLQALVEDPSGIEGTLGVVAPLVWIGRGAVEANVLDALKFTLLSAVCFAAVVALLSATFIRTATSVREQAKKKYVERPVKTQSASGALLTRELSRLWSCPAYLLNCGLGVILLLLAAVGVFVKRSSLLLLVAQFGGTDFAALLGILVASLINSTALFTAPSISLEGKTLWILQSLPVRGKDVLLAKLKMHLLICSPTTLILTVCIALSMQIGGTGLACLLVLPQLYVVFIALLGLEANLRHPNFNWTSETQAVKSGVSVLITMLVAMLAVGAPAAAFVLLRGAISGMGMCLLVAVLLIIAIVLLYVWLVRRGVELFRKM